MDKVQANLKLNFKAFMERLGLWGDGTPFKSFETFLDGITKRGLGVSYFCSPNFPSLACKKIA